MASTDSNSDDFEIIDRQEAQLAPDALAKAQAWLQPTDYTAESSEFNRHLSSHAPETGLWICNTLRFHDWHDSNDHGCLWIKGVPGAGKSVIAASMVEHLKSTDNAPILFFFFRYIIVANRRPRSLVQDWLAQLLPYSLELQTSLQSLLGNELEDVTDEQLWDHLMTGLSSVEKAYCVVDALDEMELVANDGFLRRLNTLATFRPKSVKLLMTSRPKQYLQSSLRDASIVHISLEHDLVGKDIAVFVAHRLKTALPDSDQADLRDSLESTIRTRSRGLFLYARLLMDQLIPSLRSMQTSDVENLARTLPIGLEEMYNSMLYQQAESLKIETRLQVFLLNCVINSSRPLRLNELASVLGSVFPQSKIPGTAKAITRVACSPLLEILEDETVQVIHHSFTEFLLGVERLTTPSQGKIPQFPVLDATEAHRCLTITCLNYLRSNILSAKEQDEERDVGRKTPEVITCDCDDPYDCACGTRESRSYDYQDARLRDPFLDYAVRNWSYHASQYDIEDEDFFHSITEFLDPNSSSYRRWLSIEWTTKQNSSRAQAPSPLHIAAFAGMTKYATALLREGQSVHSLDPDDRTPLHWACRRSHNKMASLLLENGANADAADCRGVKPIHEAARKNNAAIIKLLLEKGVDPITPKTREDHEGRIRGGEEVTKGETAVQYVCQQGHLESMMVMLPFLSPETLEEVLCESCRYGKPEVVQAVLENSNVSPDSKFCGATALYFACHSHNVNCIETLLARGADVDFMSEWLPRTTMCGAGGIREQQKAPIHVLIRGWGDENHVASQKILQLLMSSGADLESKDGAGETPLLTQFADRRVPSQMAVRTLLEAGVNIHAVDPKGDTSLHRFLQSHRDLRFLEMLFRHGASIDTRGSYGYTVLHSALIPLGTVHGPNDLDEIVQFLLEKGALCHLKNDHGHTALEAGIQNRECSLETFRVLLQACTDPSARRRCLWSLDRRSGQEEKIQFIQELMLVGVSLESTNSSGQTALLDAIASDDTSKALLHCGARLNAVDSKGRGALHHFVRRSWSCSSVDRLRYLIAAGLDPLKVDYDGNSLLHEAVKSYKGVSSDVAFVQQLLDFGISPNTRNLLGRTPLHIHIEEGQALSSFSELRCFSSELVPLLSLFQKLEYQLDINARDAEGLTPLHLASMRSEIDVARLLRAGADPSILTNDGRTALHLACRARMSDIVGLLLHETRTQIIDKADSFGRTPLHDACTSGRPESVCYLLKWGADIAVKDKSGRTPLHSCAEFATEQHIWSMREQQNEAAGQLYTDRFRPNAGRPNMNGKWYSSPWASGPPFTNHDTARISGIVKSLFEAGADATLTDLNQLTPLDLALVYECHGMIEALQLASMKKRTSRQEDPIQAKLLTEIALKQRAKISAGELLEHPEALREVLQHSIRYLTLLDHQDVDWIAQHGGDITGESNGFAHGSLLRTVAARGLTEMMECFGPLAQYFDNPDCVRALLKKCQRPHYMDHFAPILHAACSRELPNMEMVKLLVDKCGVDVNATILRSPSFDGGEYIGGPSALHYLAGGRYWWQLEAMRFLVERGANVECKNDQGETPLHIASGANSLMTMGRAGGFWRPSCAELLLELGADPNALDDAGLSCLHKAGSSPDIMQSLLKCGADLSVGKISPLFSAIQAHDLEALRIILDVGGSPDSRDTTKLYQVHYRVKDQERFALFCASFNGSMNNNSKHSASLVKLLIQRGASLYVPLTVQETLLHYVFEHAEYEMICAFLDYADKIDFNAKDQLGRTVFLAACNWTECLPGYRHRHWESKATCPMMTMLDHGADPMAIDSDGKNALHHLLDNPDIEQDVILHFLEHEACTTLLTQKDGNGFSPLHCALRTLRPTVCEVLLAMGADLLEPDPTGATALHRVAAQYLRVHEPQRSSHLQREHGSEYYEGCVRLWQRFLELGGDINVCDKQKSPPLFTYLSCPPRDDYQDKDSESCCHVQHFVTLFASANANARNGDGETALHVVAKRETTYFTKPTHDQKLFELMVGKGLDPLAEDDRGRSSLDIAAACGKQEIMDLFQYRS